MSRFQQQSSPLPLYPFNFISFILAVEGSRRVDLPDVFLVVVGIAVVIGVVNKDRVHVTLDLKIFFMLFHGCGVLGQAAQFESAHTSIDRDRLCDIHVGNERGRNFNESLLFLGYVDILPL